MSLRSLPLGLLVVALLTLAGCRRSTDAERPCAPRAGEVRVALSALPSTLDWNHSHEDSFRNYPVLHAMMRGLVTLDAQNRPAPGLAERWDVALTADSPPRQVYTFHLRPGVVWSDGKTPLTAQDFVVGWRRGVLGAEPASFDGIVGVDQLIAARRADAPAETVRQLAERIAVEAVDPLTLRVTLKSPRTYFLSRIAYTYPYFPAPSRELEGKSEEAIRRYFDEPEGGRPLVLGAFQVVTWDRVEQKVELVRNPYDSAPHAGEAGLQPVSRLVLREAALSPLLYRECRLDMLMLDDPAALTRAPPDTQRVPLLSVFWLGINSTRVPSLHLRRAIAHAVDRAQVTQGLLPQARVASSFLPPDMPGGLPAGDPLAAGFPQHDLEAARRELAASGYDGRELTLLVREGGTFLPELGIADAVRRQLGALGIRVRLVSTSNFANDIKSQAGTIQHDLFLRRTGSDYAHPQTLFTMFQPNGNHYTDWHRLEGGGTAREFLRVLEEGAAESEPARMKAAYARAQQMLLAEHVVVVPLFFPDRYYRKRPWLEGLGVDPFNFLTLHGLALEGGSP